MRRTTAEPYGGRIQVKASHSAPTVRSANPFHRTNAGIPRLRRIKTILRGRAVTTANAPRPSNPRPMSEPIK
jgi:hypothetical protein